MSEKNQQGKRTARERLAVERERRKAREKRRRTLVAAGTVVAVLGVAAAVGIAVAGSDGGDASASPVVTPQGATGDDGLAIPVGDSSAKSTLTVWEDFRCPACKQFEDTYRATLHQLTDSGRLKIEYHLATLIDNNSGGSGSLHAANAAACAQQVGKFPEYHDVLYENQPPETQDGYASNARLLSLAGKVPGLTTAPFKKCVDGGTHDSWVRKSDKAFQDGGFQGTPTVLLNGKNVFADQKHPLTPQRLRELVDKGKG
ncbi:DsbA family protein [Streptomyces sp. NPDC050560]|uniref:DsbA family protein n=1 Tax=Streptomyces sp. NPDC050560 TaxID=3365630 RepID=UPI0037B98220